MRIAFIHPRYPSAEGTGATHSATQIVSGLVDAGHRVRVYCNSAPEGNSQKDGIELRHLSGSSSHPHTMTRLNREVSARADELRNFDIVHSYLMRLMPSIGKIGKETDIGTVVTLNAYGGTCAKNDLLYLNQEQCQSKSMPKCLNCITRTGFSHNDNGYLYQKTSELFALRLINAGERRLEYIDGFRAPSEHVRENYVQFGYDHDKISVIPHPLDDDFSVPHRSDFTEPYNLLYIGTLSKRKGVEKLIPILTSLNKGDVQFRLTVVGTGELEGELHKQAEEFGVSDTVEFAGFVPNKDLPEIYSQHDLFVFPALWEEPLARVYLESLATGTPIITSEYGKISEIIGDGGRTVDGSVESFVEEIRGIVNENRFNELSTGAKKQSEKYQLSHTISAIENLYRGVCVN